MLLGGIEAGGTKMVCAIGDEKGTLIERVTFPTTTPDETIVKMISFFQSHGQIEALGIGCFGPIDLHRDSKTYGYITSTPKPGWRNVDIVGRFKEALGVPVGFDTDVNGAILGEVKFGAARGCDSALYITIGTGVGVGVYVNGGLLHGLLHPEAGHILLTRHPEDLAYESKCPFHENCFEGLASGPAIEKRWGRPAIELYDNPAVWELECYYIAQAIASYVLCYSPEKIVLWGGVMHKEGMYESIQKQVMELLNGYIEEENFPKDYIVSPGLGDNPGIVGALLLGAEELRRRK